MNQKELKQLQKLIHEEQDLERRIASRKFNPSEEVADTVKDYRTGYPRTIVIRGYGDTNWQRLRDKWYMKLIAVRGRIEQVENWLDSIEDAELRQLLRLRYEDGLSQEEVADRMGYSRSAIQKKEERFWKRR